MLRRHDQGARRCHSLDLQILIPSGSVSPERDRGSVSSSSRARSGRSCEPTLRPRVDRCVCLAAHRNAHAARSGGSCVLSGSLRAAASCAVDWRRNDSCPLCLWRSSHCCHSSRGRWAVDAGPPRYPRRRVDGLTSTQQRPGARSSTASNDRARTPSTMPATSAWFIRHNTSGRAWAAWRKGQLRSTM